MNKSELRSLLGLSNFCQRFDKSFAHEAGSLHILLQNNTPESCFLHEQQTQAIRSLIHAVLSPPALAPLNSYWNTP